MLVELKDLSPIRKEAEIEIPADAIRSAWDEITREFSNHVRIPGFRPGKAPIGVVQKKFARDIRDEVLERLLPKFFHDAVGTDMEPIGDPLLKDVGELVEGAPLKFVAEFEIRPTFELGTYRGLEIAEQQIEVGEKDIDETIERLRMQSSSFRPIEDRGAEEGDHLVVDIATSGDGVESRSTEDYELSLGPEAPLEELVDLMKGVKAGDERSFDKVWAEDAPNEEVAGKTVHYDVRVKAVRVLEKPDVDDSLAKGAGFDTLDALRAAIRKDLLGHKEHEAEGEKRKELTTILTESHEFDVPAVLVEEELRSAMRSYARYLESQGVDVEKAEVDWDGLRGRMQPESETRARNSLILDKIAVAEELTVNNADVDAEIRKMAGDGDFGEVKQRLRRDGTYDAIRKSLLQEKAMQLVVRESKATASAK